ncbi:MAG: glycine cleavage system protein GcvH [Candidatus Thalassarchaeaceae archaeon]|jgi:glycine cleavage system H protein|nr:glycine cleavage system protein H [Anaerolineaceae bacterium]MDP6149279.1 glycine cleavage system protein GcvH [Candidatus Thalassarchaeaceae archaeon]DAC34558.1 MAG TPA: glycine cleavage system protein GcvH [Candidatus Poseidoniales archaeon]MDP6317838.1 glycine cleavage system protein GcvH [Candidatus Thalassarchaeaceae archaeon]HIH80363.1 glycine cleavage system protein GcvH [Candidatus Thalassarchaeaceae archaeon]|tara:strand:- start:1914 stop:2297 length:384 start_codon:yes stop_codon:yes gene_type:complete
MSEVPTNLLYTAEHEWIRIEGNEVVVGVTDFAQDALTDVVWVELPEVGSNVSEMESCGSVESVKSVSEIFAPIAGEILEANESLEDAPEQINQDPYGSGWIWRMSIGDASQVDGLLDAAAYNAQLGE